MSDVLSAAFNELEDAVLRRTRLAGLDDAYATVGRRRRRRRAFITAVVVLVLLPVAAIALVRGLGGRPPDIGPSPDRTSSPDAMLELYNPTGRLADALLPVPAFPSDRCWSGPVQFDNGWVHDTPAGPNDSPMVNLYVTVSAVGDVNGDGVADLVTRLDCLYANTYLTQLVVYTRDLGGAYLTVGTVISVNGPIGPADINPDGSIRVVLQENATGEPVLKWFTYRWDGSAFARSGPAVDVPADLPSQLSVTAHLTTTGRVATMTLTVHNGGSDASDYLHVSLAARRDLVIRFGTAGADPLRGGGFGGDYGWRVDIEAVPPGSSVVGTFLIELPEPGQSTDLTVSVTGATVRTFDQPNIDDANRVTVTLKAA